MLRTSDNIPLDGQPMVPPAVDFRHEWPLPGSPLLCLLVPYGDRVEAVVNTAHGLEGYRHAAYHAERGLAGAHACAVGDPCGYDPAVRRGPECAPSRRAPLGGAGPRPGKA